MPSPGSPHSARITVAICLLALLPLTAAGEDEKKPANSARVEGTFTFPADAPAIEGVELTVILFEYDPRLADAGADKLDEVKVPNVSHIGGEATKVEFVVGDGKTTRPDRKYYVSCRGYKAGAYVYYGKPTHDDMGHVHADGKPARIEFIGQPIKR